MIIEIWSPRMGMDTISWFEACAVLRIPTPGQYTNLNVGQMLEDLCWSRYRCACEQCINGLSECLK